MQIKDMRKSLKMTFTKFVSLYIIYMFVSGNKQNRTLDSIKLDITYKLNIQMNNYIYQLNKLILITYGMDKNCCGNSSGIIAGN